MSIQTDVDECADLPWICQPVGSCENTIGSYTCACPSGYQRETSTGKCIDLDECEDDLMCQYGCINLVGGYRCDCPVGFVQHYYWNQCIGLLPDFNWNQCIDFYLI